jgi:hypothetical protein
MTNCRAACWAYLRPLLAQAAHAAWPAHSCRNSSALQVQTLEVQLDDTSRVKRSFAAPAKVQPLESTWQPLTTPDR